MFVSLYSEASGTGTEGTGELEPRAARGGSTPGPRGPVLVGSGQPPHGG